MLKTKRLVVKKPTPADFEDLYLLLSDPEVMCYVGRGIKTEKEVHEDLKIAINHYQKYRISLGNIYEKETGLFVGQAGLAYLIPEDKSADIEVSYVLHKKFRHKGYATELVKAFIHWGFNYLPTQSLMAIVPPENDKSRRLLEKIGMQYRERENRHNAEVAKYIIYKNNIEHSNIELIPATLADYPVIQNMGRFYVYDMSEFMGWDIPKDGLYECKSFEEYFKDKNTFPFLIHYNHILAGFAIVDKKGSDDTIDFNMAQFFILRKFKNKGIARHVAHECFNKFQGTWEVMVMPGNEGAYRFWRSIIKKYCGSQFIETTREIAHFENARKNIFKFNTHFKGVDRTL